MIFAVYASANRTHVLILLCHRYLLSQRQ